MALEMVDDRTQYVLEDQLLILVHPVLACVVKRQWEGAYISTVEFM